MAGSTLTVTSVTNPSLDDKKQNTIVLDWLSDDTGGSLNKDIAATYAAAQLALSTYHIQPDKIKGYLVKIETIPGALGDKSTDCPTDLYDMTLVDAYDYDLAGGLLANLSDDTAETVVPSTPIWVNSEISVVIANAGNSKKGRIILHFSPTV